ncbi:MAG: fold metallo-hydrolase [Chloroflexi bacterium]|nr:fold metallo-hydrolase [Chloroflexota bacterium]
MTLEIEPRVFQLRAFGAHVFALVDDDVTLIDTGAPGSGRLVLRQLQEIGHSPSDVKRIILTHYHIDHRGAARELQEATGARVFIHKSEAPYLRGQQRYPNLVSSGPLARLAAPFSAAMRLRPVQVEELDDGDVIAALGGLRVLHSPGHTRGSISLWFKETGLLFSGDAMEYRRGRLLRPGRQVTEDMDVAEATLRRLAQLGTDRICFSHFPAFRGQAADAFRALLSELDQQASVQRVVKGAPK